MILSPEYVELGDSAQNKDGNQNYRKISDQGDSATLIPSVRLCFIVCVRTRVSRGPGEGPDVRPSKTPAEMYCQRLPENSYYLALWCQVYTKANRLFR